MVEISKFNKADRTKIVMWATILIILLYKSLT